MKKVYSITLILTLVILCSGCSINPLKNQGNDQNVYNPEYNYSNCPSKCDKKCIPSICDIDPDFGNEICTNDCDGYGSCICN